MRIVTYNLEKDENDMPMLVKRIISKLPIYIKFYYGSRGSSSCTQPGFAA